MAFLGIKLPQEFANLLNEIQVPGKKEQVNEFHITFVHFGKDEIDEKKFMEVLKCVQNCVSNIEPFFISFNSIDCFPQGDDGFPIILPIQSKELQKIHSNVTKELDKNDIDFSKKFKVFHPHITLSYSDKPIKKQKFKEVGFTVTEIILFGGSKDQKGLKGLMTKFPLKMETKARREYFEILKLAERMEMLNL